jgi:uncharacterized protein YprB with RNaseH-like and TPR domain
MAMSESRKKKLQMLVRSLARGDFAAARNILTPGDVADERAAKERAELRAPIPLEQACPGSEAVIATPAGEGRYWIIRRSLADVAPDSLAIARQYADVMRGARFRLSTDDLKPSAELWRAADLSPGNLLFMDIETCGLSGCAIFLVGMMRHADGQLVFEQCLARNYAEEPAILRAFFDRLAETGVLVTFNGKAFDMKQISERAVFHGLELPDHLPPHLDLLHEARRRWRADVPNCRLQTLERLLCGRHRCGDIPGPAIPDAYHGFVLTADARRIGDILHHNLMDMLTMAQLLCVLLTGEEPSPQ